jgi:hypothetical protein
MSQTDTDIASEAAPSDESRTRALVAIEGRAQSAQTGAFKRPDAAFLTQILASNEHMGPFRRYRREEPATAMARYAAAAALSDGRTPLKRSA